MGSRDNPNRNRVFIGRLNPEARSRDLERFFKDNGFSRLKDVSIKLGYAFVEFEDKRDADDAVYELNRKEFFGSSLTVEHVKRGPKTSGDDRSESSHQSRGRQRPYNTEWRIIVTNLSSRVGWQDLKDYFRSAGEVTFTKANTEKVGEGVVEFRTHREMEKAIKKFDGSEFFDRRIKCIDDSPPQRPARSRSPTRSRSRSRSRSRNGTSYSQMF